MTTPATPSDPQSTPVESNLAKAGGPPAASNLEDTLHRFWKNNRTGIAIGCTLVLLVLVGKGLWELYEARQESDVRREYAAAATPEKLRAFAAAHPQHVLGGLAQLRLADDAYSADKFAEASTAYDKAAATLKEGPLAARAQLGSAIAKLQAGKTADGEAALKALSRDISQLKGVRAEATYHLASFAAAAGKGDDVVKYSEQLMQLDPSSAWTQRALALRATIPMNAPAQPEISLMPGKK